MQGVYDPNGAGAIVFAVLAVAAAVEREGIREKTGRRGRGGSARTGRVAGGPTAGGALPRTGAPLARPHPLRRDRVPGGGRSGPRAAQLRTTEFACRYGTNVPFLMFPMALNFPDESVLRPGHGLIVPEMPVTGAATGASCSAQPRA
ncbi:hypothetical protein SCWH03_55400 [Streptomyces pacificus]|uniref:Uncharacterized protein n=1 Tax=Streptomyces pacificus TaxID=2705029 RepID=A0A6A0B3L0_9ACTN|nr:hypothetical protein SCWH03_55400 [Streptomyces pacificus]